MNRRAKFLAMSEHPMFSKLIRRLSKVEYGECLQFIDANDALDANRFAEKVNRWKLDQPKTKRHSDMWALVMQTNTEDL